MSNVAPEFKVKWLLTNNDALNIYHYLKQYVFAVTPEMKLVPFKRGGLLICFYTNCMSTVEELRALRAELGNKYKFKFI